LMQLSEQIARHLAREKRLAQAQAQTPAPKTLRTPDEQVPNLAQMGMGGMMGQPGPGRGGMMPGGGMGGPGMPGAANAQPDDYGQDLVDLIQRTIAPGTWDVNGGAGSAYYWHPGRAMIIMQTGEVHDQIADLLLQLERAGH